MQTNPNMMSNALDAIDQQITSGTFPETKTTFSRLTQTGYAAKEARHLMAQVFVHELFMIKNHGQTFDRNRYGAMLQQLPRLPMV
uniref:Uncharacterized protein n=1 Tax=Magnetococcus massalia (strain MO-1) TaxID=451514 RepID=A0A1S7LFD9_MAGMO|nr:Conserved protein of unknown function [Candidatus Magnetococcus massalia]